MNGNRWQEKSFMVAVTDRRRYLRDRSLRSYVGDEARRERAKKPHEYVNGGVMCQLCGLADGAPIHAAEAQRQ